MASNVTVSKQRKDGPIHFYPTIERPANLALIVEYCVQKAERQPLLPSQADHLVCSKQVLVNGSVDTRMGASLPIGAYELTIRGRKHHVLIHPPISE